ncbi:sugar phosphate isomerase/epimerase [Hydrogenispora ethanolica]|uniref:Sugar phosphate isomerase/epimerase n=1 Tax=Hydrogenispora ethanolica TaxID=1082276 RepID=A0A4V2QEC1_HYDET|nr:sugar phosphate isomerase/epimerase [Hydrogenispora ethanolica]TCL67387.1 sugar phosphate isomerase/epimerase [Hydrogenispora ethanolica]
MKVGLLTNSLAWAGMKELREIAAWAAAHGFADLEVGPSIPLDERVFNEVLEEGGIGISALIYCRNFLSENPQEAAEHQRNLKERLVFAHQVGIQKVVCSTGVTPASFNGMRFDPEKSVAAVAEFLQGLADLAEAQQVKICIENCPMMGNIAISPYMWEILFDKVRSDYLGLAFDPSHMVWQFMSPYENIIKFREKIFHVHGKDTEVLYDNLNRVGILHNITTEGHFYPQQWWRHRLPGLGDLDWNKIVANLDEIGYTGVISIEHEDPVWEGTLEKVQQGLLKAKNHIESFL